MTDWIEHDGGPQPVADDVWVYVIDPIEGHFQSTAAGVDWPGARHYFVLNQHLIDAARLEGIRLGLEAAAQRADLEWSDPEAERATNSVASTIRALDPETIAKEAAPPARKDHRADAAADAFYVEEADQ